MTLTEFSSDVMPIISGFIATIGMFFIWRQLQMATAAMERTSNWNKIHATYTFFDLERNTKIEKQLYDAGKKIEVRFLGTLTDEELDKLVKDNDTFVYAKEFLNDFETLCAAYQIGALDKKLAFHLHGTRVVKEFKVLHPFITWLRKKFNDEGILIEIQKTAKEWEKLLAEEQDDLEKLREKVGAKSRQGL